MGTTKRLWALIALETVVIAALAVVLGLRGTGEKHGTGANMPPSGKPSGNTGAAADLSAVARIEGKTFTKQELYEELGRRYGTLLINQLLDREAIRLEGKALGIGVSSDDVDKELKRMQSGYDSEEQFYASMKEQLGMDRLQIREDALYKLLLERIATQNIKITDDQVNQYISQHPEEFASGLELHLAQIVSASKELADKAYGDLRKGTDFAVVARDRSVDDATANSGGDLGWVEADDPFVAAPVLNAAKALKPGTYSQPIALDNGKYAIVLLMERKEKKGADEATMKEQVRKQLALSEAPPLQELVKQLRTKYHAEILDPSLIS